MVGKEVLLACERRSVWGMSDMLYADNASAVSKSAEGLAKLMTVVVTVFKAPVHAVWGNRTETMLSRTPCHTSLAPPLVVKTATQRYRHMTQFINLGSALSTKALSSRSKLPDGSDSCRLA